MKSMLPQRKTTPGNPDCEVFAVPARNQDFQTVSNRSMSVVLTQGRKQNSFAQSTQNVPSERHDGLVCLVRHPIPMHTQGQHQFLVKINPIGLARCLRFFATVGEGSYNASPNTSHKATNISCTSKNGIQVSTLFWSVFGSLIGIKAQYSKGSLHPFNMLRNKSLEMFPLSLPNLPARANPCTPEAPALVALWDNCWVVKPLTRFLRQSELEKPSTPNNPETQEIVNHIQPIFLGVDWM